MNTELTTTEDPGLAAEGRLQSVARDLKLAKACTTGSTAVLHALVITARAQGMSAPAIAEAIDRGRNYVDSLWSSTDRGKVMAEELNNGILVSLEDRVTPQLLANARQVQKDDTSAEDKARKARDAAVVSAYTEGILGPTRIAKAVGIDRNHVLRLTRKAGVAPKYRKNIQNQYTKQS